jgi:capsular polysaccharide biosynthesis protein
MEPIQYMKTIRGRWIVIALALVVGLTAAFVTRGLGSKTPRRKARPVYTAEAVVLTSGGSRAPGLGNLDTLSGLAALDNILERVAKKIDYDGDPGDLSNRIQVTPDEATGFLKFTATGRAETEAEDIANGFAKAIVNFVSDQQLADFEEEKARIEERLEEVRKEIDRLNAEIAVASEEKARGLRPLLDQEIRTQQTLNNELQQLNASLDQLAKVELVQIATAERRAEGGPAIPSGISIRLIIGALAGLLLGFGLVLLLEKLNTRIRDGEAAENHYRVPVLARIPHISSRLRKSGPVVVLSAPSTPAADSFRVLAASSRVNKLHFRPRGAEQVRTAAPKSAPPPRRQPAAESRRQPTVESSRPRQPLALSAPSS